jgi:hypothetical protein
MSIFNNGINGLPQNGTGGYSDILGQIMGYGAQNSLIGQQSALETSYVSYLDLLNSAQGQRAMLELNRQNTNANIALDLQQASLRFAYGQMTKQVEQYVLNGQIMEKLANLFFELEKNKMDNTWQRAKTVVGSAKY